jgi:hypothetical protein
MATALEEDGLVGSVKAVRTEKRRLSRQLGETGERRPFVHATSYDSEGRRVETIAVNPDGSHVKRRFSEQRTEDGGRRVEVACLDVRDTVLGTTRSVYDTQGRLIEHVSYGPDGSLISATAARYTASGDRMEAIDRPPGPEGSVLHGLTMEGSRLLVAAPGAAWRRTVYGAHGKPVQVLFQDSRGSTLVRVVFDYDDALRVVREVHYTRGLGVQNCDPPGNSAGRQSRWDTVLASVVFFAMVVWGYARRGRLGEVLRAFTGRIPSSEVVNVYDGAGRHVEEVHYFLGKLLDRRKVQYDAQGRQVEAACYDTDGSLLSRCRFDREFDGYGNWTRETMFIAVGRFAFFTPESVTERTITYY